MKILCGGLVGLCVLGWLPCHAQERHLRFDHLSVEQGLSNAWVQSILKDSRGFLWFGTQDGLNRYDGAGIKICRPRVGVASPIEPRQACRQEGTS
jgi:ligand-binding sensor domain-containing protein